MARRGRSSRNRGSFRESSAAEDCPWDLPKPPARPHQLPYSPLVTKKGVDVYILRMNRDVGRAQMQRGLFRLLRDHVLIYHLTVEMDMFGSINGHLVLPSRSDVRDIVRKFHRTGFYGRTLEFSELDPNIPIPVAYKKAVMGIFEERKKTRLLLPELLRIFEEEYDQCLTVLDILKMPDIIERYTEGCTQMIRLLPSSRSFRSNLASIGCMDVLQPARCMDCWSRTSFSHGSRPCHSHNGKSMTCYRISLAEFAPQVLKLLRTHHGSMILSSFVSCYEANYGPLEEDETDGIYLEHLLSCVNGVEFQRLPYESRKIVIAYQWDTNGKDSRMDYTFQEEHSVFHREVYDMLTSQRGCTLQFSDFVQSYRMNYGKTCRVADFGCTRLADLLGLFHETMEVLGTGVHRVLTLTHKEQLRRFGRLLDQIRDRCYVDRIQVDNFHDLYEHAFTSHFVPTDFGVCFVEDLFGVKTEYVGSLSMDTPDVHDPFSRMVRADDSGGFGQKADGPEARINGDAMPSSIDADKSSLPEAKMDEELSSSSGSWCSLSDNSSDSNHYDSATEFEDDPGFVGGVQESLLPVKPPNGVISSRLALRFY